MIQAQYVLLQADWDSTGVFGLTEVRFLKGIQFAFKFDFNFNENWQKIVVIIIMTLFFSSYVSLPKYWKKI